MPDKSMDLKRRLGLVSGGGQSYELIRSTQSLVDRLNLNSEEISIQPVHPSIMGQDNWFSITYTSSNTTRYFSCQNSRERDEWITSLRKTLTPAEDRRRTENSLKMWVFEVKGLSDKKKYFCEIHLDDKIYARTSSKKMLGMCFWGEYFAFSELPKAEKITILIYKDKGKVRRQRKPVGRVKICVSSVQSRREVEKWYPVEKSSRRESPSLRLKCQFQSIDILPLREYEDLLKFLKDEYRGLCKMLEPHISVKVKEELAYSLMNVFKIQDIAEDILADIVVHEISSNDNESLTFRGNSIATKAMEAYVKMVSEKYLEDTLRPTLVDILNSDLDLEVDPVKVGGGGSSTNSSDSLLHSHRQDLRNVVSIVWKRIANSHSLFPVQLQRCFHKIRQFLVEVGKPEMADKLVSSCLFLRYLCPAILGPNLFGLTEEFPGERSNRNLTLIAKTLQTLANFARYEGKENSMEFMNGFLDEEMTNMKTFLQLVSGPPPLDWIHGIHTIGNERGELGRHLSSLHTILVENVSKIPNSASDIVNMDHLKTILNDINSNLHRPSTSTLDNIAEPTPVKIKRMSVEDRTPNTATLPHHHHTTSSSSTPSSTSSSSSHQNNVISNWMSWTLGRGEKKSKVSHPIPQHELKSSLLSASSANSKTHGSTATTFYHHHPDTTASTTTARANNKTTFYSPDVTESSSSSASLTPSPKYSANQTIWTSAAHKAGIRKGSWKSASSISIIDDSDSESSSNSSHYRGDTTAMQFSTLPRQRTETKTLSDYEREIHGLRAAMETLQVKLQDAERKLQSQQASGSTTSSSDRSTVSPPRSSSSCQEQEQGGYYTTGVRYSPPANNNNNNKTAVEDVKEIISRLLKEEDLLRRDQQALLHKMGDKELMILLQQRKIAALDEANNRLLTELTRLGDKAPPASSSGLGGAAIRTCTNKKPLLSSSSSLVPHMSATTTTTLTGGSVTTVAVGQQQQQQLHHHHHHHQLQETPKTVDELLDSFNVQTPV